MAESEATLEGIRSDTLYAVGASDAIAGILAIMANRLDLDEQDIAALGERCRIYHPEHEADRRAGFTNIVDAFRSY